MFKTDNSPGFYIHYTDRLYDNTLNKMIRDADIELNTIHWSTLNQLLQYPGLTQRELALKCYRDPSAITKTLDVLEKKGLICRKTDLSDRRIFRIYVTEKGKDIHDEIEPIAQELKEIATKNIPQEDLEILYDVLIRISVNLLNTKNVL